MRPPLYTYFGGHRKTHAIVRRAKFLYLLVASRFLPTEVVAGETNDRYAIFELLIKFLQLLILRRVTTFGGHIYHNDLSALVPGKINLLSCDPLYLKFMDRIHYLRFSYPKKLFAGKNKDFISEKPVSACAELNSNVWSAGLGINAGTKTTDRHFHVSPCISMYFHMFPHVSLPTYPPIFCLFSKSNNP